MAKKETIKSFVLRMDAETMEAIEWQNEEKEDNNQKGRKRMIQLF